MVALNRFFSRLSWDVIGFSASAVCAIHCMVVPFLLLASSFSGLEVLHNHQLETYILIFSAAIGSVSIIPSWIKHHRKALPVLLFFTGLAFMALGRLHFPVWMETLLTTGGASVVATAHYVNWRICRPYHASTQTR